jgi:GNAT superfamily N-acetyltransferase
MIRPTVPEDTPRLVELVRDTGVFKPHEVETLREVMDDFHRESHKENHHSITMLQQDRIVGFAYFAPAPMTDRTWQLYWIAVEQRDQAKGLGGTLLKEVEEQITKLGGRVLFIETSSLDHYDKTRRFYLKKGYEQDAVLHDFYTDGDNMVVFRKQLLS